MVEQDKKIGEVCICVNMRRLNDACLHDPFPTPFINEVEGGKGCIVLLMDFMGTIKPGLKKKINIKPPSQHSGVASNT